MNKKVKNANPYRYQDLEEGIIIDFKSKLEMDAYLLLKKEGLKPKYEHYMFILMPEFKPTIPFYRSTKCLPFREQKAKVSEITYTPDFYIEYKNTVAIVEMKGFPNDVYPVKKKLFRSLLEEKADKSKRIIFFEVKSLREIKKAIEIIKDDTEES